MSASLKNTRNGFSVVELVIIIAIVGVIGGAGYFVYSSQSNDTTKNADSSQVAEDGIPAINKAEDLDTVNQTIDDTNIDSVDAELESLDSELADI